MTILTLHGEHFVEGGKAVAQIGLDVMNTRQCHAFE